jgi:hypothetical protein
MFEEFKDALINSILRYIQSNDFNCDLPFDSLPPDTQAAMIAMYPVYIEKYACNHATFGNALDSYVRNLADPVIQRSMEQALNHVAGIVTRLSNVRAEAGDDNLRLIAAIEKIQQDRATAGATTHNRETESVIAQEKINRAKNYILELTTPLRNSIADRTLAVDLNVHFTQIPRATQAAMTSMYRCLISGFLGDFNEFSAAMDRHLRTLPEFRNLPSPEEKEQALRYLASMLAKLNAYRLALTDENDKNNDSLSYVLDKIYSQNIAVKPIVNKPLQHKQLNFDQSFTDALNNSIQDCLRYPVNFNNHRTQIPRNTLAAMTVMYPIFIQKYRGDVELFCEAIDQHIKTLHRHLGLLDNHSLQTALIHFESLIQKMAVYRRCVNDDNCVDLAEVFRRIPQDHLDIEFIPKQPFTTMEEALDQVHYQSRLEKRNALILLTAQKAEADAELIRLTVKLDKDIQEGNAKVAVLEQDLIAKANIITKAVEACKSGDLEPIIQLKKLDKDSWDWFCQNRPLMLAIAHEQADVVSYLLDNDVPYLINESFLFSECDYAIRLAAEPNRTAAQDAIYQKVINKILNGIVEASKGDKISEKLNKYASALAYGPADILNLAIPGENGTTVAMLLAQNNQLEALKQAVVPVDYIAQQPKQWVEVAENINELDGWSCFDVAVGLNRDDIVDYALQNSGKKEFRELLAPEIKSALVQVVFYMNLLENYNNSVEDFMTAPEGQKDEIANHIAALAMQLEEFPEDAKFLLEHMYSDDKARTEMYDIISQGDTFIPENQGKINIDMAISAYCARHDIYLKYVNQYYGNQQWFAFNGAFEGEKPTSMVDIVARRLNKRIVIHDQQKLYATAYAGDDEIHIHYKNNQHFVRLVKADEEDILDNAAGLGQPLAQEPQFQSGASKAKLDAKFKGLLAEHVAKVAVVYNNKLEEQIQKSRDDIQKVKQDITAEIQEQRLKVNEQYQAKLENIELQVGEVTDAALAVMKGDYERYADNLRTAKAVAENEWRASIEAAIKANRKAMEEAKKKAKHKRNQMLVALPFIVVVATVAGPAIGHVIAASLNIAAASTAAAAISAVASGVIGGGLTAAMANGNVLKGGIEGGLFALVGHQVNAVAGNLHRVTRTAIVVATKSTLHSALHGGNLVTNVAYSVGSTVLGEALVPITGLENTQFITQDDLLRLVFETARYSVVTAVPGLLIGREDWDSVVSNTIGAAGAALSGNVGKVREQIEKIEKNTEANRRQSAKDALFPKDKWGETSATSKKGKSPRTKTDGRFGAKNQGKSAQTSNPHKKTLVATQSNVKANNIVKPTQKHADTTTDSNFISPGEVSKVFKEFIAEIEKQTGLVFTESQKIEIMSQIEITKIHNDDNSALSSEQFIVSARRGVFKVDGKQITSVMNPRSTNMNVRFKVTNNGGAAITGGLENGKEIGEYLSDGLNKAGKFIKDTALVEGRMMSGLWLLFHAPALGDGTLNYRPMYQTKPVTKVTTEDVLGANKPVDLPDIPNRTEYPAHVVGNRDNIHVRPRSSPMSDAYPGPTINNGSQVNTNHLITPAYGGALAQNMLKGGDGVDRINPPDRDKKYHIAPVTIPFPSAKLVRPKNMRKRWQLDDGRIAEWDRQHGEIEMYNKNGKHIGVYSPDTGLQIKPAVPGRKIET